MRQGPHEEALKGTTATVSLGEIERFSAPPKSFDVVVSRVAFHYVEDIGAVLRACHACLTDSGRLVFSVVHPVITSHDARVSTAVRRSNWVVDAYFVRARGLRPGSAATWCGFIARSNSMCANCKAPVSGSTGCVSADRAGNFWAMMTRSSGTVSAFRCFSCLPAR
jgi:SAM-dependent methyltransferase